jgi:mannosyl-oligosaccharide alpha-1,2-mannosidase
MHDQDVVNQILDYVPTINFDNATGTISLFETTIRYLGGLLSGKFGSPRLAKSVLNDCTAHDLLTGPAADLVQDNDKVSALLSQAEHLADLLSVAFNTDSGVPINDLDWSPPRPQDESTNGIATIGTLVLEWTRLSDKLGVATYAQLSQNAESYLLNPQPSLGEPFPGLLGTNVAVSNGSFVDSEGSWGGGDDSFYEYLIKMYVYDKNRFGEYKDRWIKAIDSSIQYLTSHPTTRPDVTFLAGWYNSQELFYSSQHRE